MKGSCTVKSLKSFARKTRILSVGTALLICLTCQYINAQNPSSGDYRLTLRGEPSPFDTSVNIYLPTYRKIRLKIQDGGYLIDSLGLEIRSLSRGLEISDSLQIVLNEENQVLRGANVRKDSTIMILRSINQDQNKIAVNCLEEKKKWHNSPWVGPGCAVLGIIIRSFF